MTEAAYGRRATDKPRSKWRNWMMQPAPTRVWLSVFFIFNCTGTTLALVTSAANSRASNNAAAQAKRVAAAVQLQRVDNTFASCKAQDQHRSDAIAQFRRLVAAAEGPATRSARARAEASEQPIVLLIDALQPYEDCPATVFKSTGVRVSAKGKVIGPLTPSPRSTP